MAVALLQHKWVKWTLTTFYVVIGLLAVLAFLFPTVKRMQDEQRVLELEPMVRVQAALEQLDPALVMAVILIESSGRIQAQSSKQAMGLMQIRRVAEKDVARLRRDVVAGGDLMDPAYNIQIGCAYLHILMDRFKNDEVLALSAYNCGPTKVARWRRAYPSMTSRALIDAKAPKETRQYFRKVLKARAYFKEALEQSQAGASSS